MRSIAPVVIAGRYEVGELLGRGGMADVYAGVDRRLERDVAIKLLQEPMAARADIRSRFEAEAKAAATLTQPHAVAVFDTGEHDGVPYIVMERLPGRTFADRIAEGSVPVADVRAMATQVLGALGAAHAAGIVHRDVKPANILLTADGSSKIADFGIAKSLDVVTDLTGTGQVLGTPAYLAPEQVEGRPASPGSDLYALGVVIYEALAGRKPFDGSTPVAVAQAIVAGTYRPLSELNPDVDAALADVVERAMHRDPARRFPNAAGMAAALSVSATPTAPIAAVPMAAADATEALDATSLLPVAVSPPVAPPAQPEAAQPVAAQPVAGQPSAAEPSAAEPRRSALRPLSLLLAGAALLLLLVVARVLAGDGSTAGLTTATSLPARSTATTRAATTRAGPTTVAPATTSRATGPPTTLVAPFVIELPTISVPNLDEILQDHGKGKKDG